MTRKTDIVEARVVVTGRVQGVAFRAYTVDAAVSANVCGWVRNLPHQQVEAVLQGERDDVEKVVAFMRTGPPAAQVIDASVSWRAPVEYFHGFEIRH